MATDVVIAGGGPNGLLMACELALADVRVVVLERLLERPTAPKANGLVGRVVQALDYRGLYERFSGGNTPPVPAPGFQFGALPLPARRQRCCHRAPTSPPCGSSSKSCCFSRAPCGTSPT